MVMAQIPIYLSLDDLELLSELKGRYKLHNLSESVRLIITQWRKLMSDKEKTQKELRGQSRKPVNPMVNS